MYNLIDKRTTFVFLKNLKGKDEMKHTKGKRLIIAIIMFVASLLISIYVFTCMIFITLAFSGKYIIENPTDQNYLKGLLIQDIKMDIPSDANITKIELKIFPDQSTYNVTYMYEEKEESIEKTIDWGMEYNNYEIDNYLKENGKNIEALIGVVVTTIQVLQVLLPIASFLYLFYVLLKED